MIKVTPKNLFGIEVHSILIGTLSVNLGVSARTTVTLLDKNGNALMQRDTLISEEEYKLWGDDDSYIEDLILNNLELERAG